MTRRGNLQSIAIRHNMDRFIAVRSNTCAPLASNRSSISGLGCPSGLSYHSRDDNT
jgi:hypothetical protein